MINNLILELFSRAYHPVNQVDHYITDEVVVIRTGLRRRVGLRLISLGHQLSGPEGVSHIAA